MQKKLPKTKLTFNKIADQTCEYYAWDETQKIITTWFANKIAQVSKKNNYAFRMQKQIRFLRSQKKSKLTTAFFQPWKKIIPPLSRKQLHMKRAYLRYRHLRFQDRIDFFRSYIGQMMLQTEIHSQVDEKNPWWGGWDFKDLVNRSDDLEEEAKDLIWRAHFFQDHNSWWETHSQFAKISKKSWWYDNLITKKARFKSGNNFALYRPRTAFQLHWKQSRNEPWKNALLFRRAVYAAFGESFRRENQFQGTKIKSYLRHKNPRSEKRNQLYKRSSLLLNNFRQRSRIPAKKAARIKNILSKIIWPFYGDLRAKQMRVLATKSKHLKSKTLTRDEILLNHLENRLDVVVYRLNLAPTILWARRLIENGSVFVTPQKSTSAWDSMYASLKKIAFPLQLRDPKKLYLAQFADPFWGKFGMFKFLGQPQKKIAYLLQPGDLIQCTAGNSLHQFKTNTLLWQKPLPTHLLTQKAPSFIWSWRREQVVTRSYNNWEQTSPNLNAAIFLYAPRFQDLDAKDRIKESFVRWTIM